MVHAARDEGHEMIWCDGTGGELMTPDAMEQLLRERRDLLVGRTASTVVLRWPGCPEQTFQLVRDDTV